MVKKSRREPSNEEQDAMCLQYGHAYTMHNRDKSEWLLTPSLDTVREYQKQGWRCRWEIHRDNFYPNW